MALALRRPWSVKPTSGGLNYSLDRTRALIGYWPCLEQAGMNIRDLSQNRLDCPLGQLGSTPPLWLPGKFGTSFNGGGNGGGGNFGSIPSAAVLNPTVFTLEAWFRIDSTPGASHAGIIGKWATNGTMLVILNTMVLQFYGNGTALSTSALSLGVWYHAVGTYDGTNGSLYLNGQLIATGALPYTATSTPFELGRYNQAQATACTGRIDLGAFYNRVLDPAEIQDQYLNPLGMLAPASKHFWVPSADITLFPAAGSIVYTPGTPVTLIDTFFPPPGAITYTGGTPTVTVGETLAPAAGAITYTPGTPTLKITLSPAAGTIIYSPATPVVSLVRTGPPTAGATSLLINNVAWEWVQSTFRIDKNLSGAWTASFQVDYRGGTMPNPGEEVAFFWEGTKRFGGLIQSVAESDHPTRFDISRLTIQCTGFQSYCDRVIVAKLYTLNIGAVPAIIVFDLWFEHLAQFGVTLAYPQGEISFIGEQLFHYITVTEALNRIKDQTPGWEWWIDDNKAFHFSNVTPTAGTAPFTLRNNDRNVESMTVTRSNARFRNKQWVLPSANLVALRTDSDVGDGATRSFFTVYALTAKPIVRVDGVDQIVTELGNWVAGYQWYYIPDGTGVFQNPADTPVGVGLAIDILSPNPFPVGFSAEDDTSIAAVGLYEAVQQAKNVVDQATAEDEAQGLLDLYETDGAFPQSISFVYNSKNQASWLLPGMVLDVDRTCPTALGFYAVEQVTSEEHDLTLWKHTVVLRAGLGDVTDAQALEEFRKSARTSITLNPPVSTWQIGMDVPGLTNPGLSVGLLKDRWTCPPIAGGGGVTIASWNGFFPVDPPTGADFIADFLLNGVSIFPAGDANKMVIPDGSSASVSGFTFLTPNIRVVEGDVLTMNIIQVGSTTPGSNALFHLNFVR